MLLELDLCKKKQQKAVKVQSQLKYKLLANKPSSGTYAPDAATSAYQHNKEKARQKCSDCTSKK